MPGYLANQKEEKMNEQNSTPDVVFSLEKRKLKWLRWELSGMVVSGVVMMAGGFSLTVESLHGAGAPAMLVANVAMGWFARGFFSASRIDTAHRPD